jgi:hypothetical protein
LAVALRVASRAEVGAVLDAPLGQVDYRPAVLEALAAAEFQSAIGGASPVAQVENLVLADDSDGIGGITPVVIAEIGVALDTPTGAAQLFSVAAESLSAADTLDGTDSASMFESLVANDVPDAVMITSGSIAEGTASAQDVATAAAVWEMAVAETAAAADFQIPVVMIPPVFETEPRSNITLRPKGARLGTPVIQPQDSSLG